MPVSAPTLLAIDLPAGKAGLADAVAGFELDREAALTEAHRFDAVLICGATPGARWPQHADLPQAAHDSALVVALDATAAADAERCAELLRLGVQDVVAIDEPAAIARALRHAIERKRLEIAARRAYATDLATGLPHETQLIEHLSQLLALRVREPRPMALLVLRVQGFATAAQRLGPEAANILRRKVAVRLRGGLRASDVVAAIGSEAFGILLGRMEVPADAERVAGKLVRALQQPFNVAGQGHAVAVTIGMALVPEHGTDAAALLRRAAMQAATAGVGIDGQAVRIGRAGAANDEGP
jgi:diguanylate cyclase (GGDEF)-like protein